MEISSLNINKFCGPYRNPATNGGYYNPRNIDYKTQIKSIVDTHLKTSDDIFFLQEVINNKYIDLFNLFPDKYYIIHFNMDKLTQSHVIAITLKNSNWKEDSYITKDTPTLLNKFLKMTNKDLIILSVHNTDIEIENYINHILNQKLADIIIGDFNKKNWTTKLDNIGYRDLITSDMITYKPAQTTIDHIFIKKQKNFEGKIVFNGISETYTTDHNLISFQLNIKP